MRLDPGAELCESSGHHCTRVFGDTAHMSTGQDNHTHLVDTWMEQLEAQLVAPAASDLGLQLGQGVSFESSEHEASQVAALSSEMVQAMAHPLRAGGKRMRPRLCLLLAQAIGGASTRENALRAAKALELVHTYSLVHDDLPCMDNDDWRRGQPTTHKLYGEAKALLVGDALLTEAFVTLARLQTVHQPHIASLGVQILALASGHRGMIAGQWLDISGSEAAQGQGSSLARLQWTHILKTGHLMGAALELGALCGMNERELSTQSSSQLRDLARTAGIELGLAFQLVDDVLDATASQAELGKTPGKDAAQGKSTAVGIMGLEPAKIEAARVTESATVKIQTLLDRLPAPDEVAEEARPLLFALIQALMTRRS